MNDHADQLATRFENYEPKPGGERPAEEYLLQRADLARAHSERQTVEAVTAARAKSVPSSALPRTRRSSATAPYRG